MSARRTVIGLRSGVASRNTRRPRVILVGIAVLAAIGLLGGESAFASTSSSFSYSGSSGNVSVSATCDHVTHRGTVDLSAQHPTTATNGMYFYTQVYVKNRNTASWSNALLLDQRQTYINGWSSQPIAIWGGTMVINSPKTVVSGLGFNGANWNYYDIGVRYWTALPGGQWSASTWFTASSVFEVTGAYGYGIEAGTCML